MIENYIPNTYNKELISKFKPETFLDFQIKYRKSLELYFMQKIDFRALDNILKELKLPEIINKDDNFYHKYSTLNSKYFFLRNNIHIENLNFKELLEIKDATINNQLLKKDFIIQTYQKVLYEKKDSFIYGIPNIENELNSKSIIFEIAYNRENINDLQTKILLDYRLPLIKEELQQNLESELGLQTSIIINDGQH